MLDYAILDVDDSSEKKLSIGLLIAGNLQILFKSSISAIILQILCEKRIISKVHMFKILSMLDWFILQQLMTK